MQSKKPIFKKAFEPIDHYEESTWMGNDTPFMETEYTGVFSDKYPCTPGHTLFIPKKNTPEYVGQSYGLAYEYGNKKIKEGKMMGFNVCKRHGNIQGRVGNGRRRGCQDEEEISCTW